jgi:hypothetical protein
MPDRPEDQEALDAYMQAIAGIYTQQLQAAVEEAPLLPRAWREASTLSNGSACRRPDRPIPNPEHNLTPPGTVGPGLVEPADLLVTGYPQPEPFRTIPVWRRLRTGGLGIARI